MKLSGKIESITRPTSERQGLKITGKYYYTKKEAIIAKLRQLTRHEYITLNISGNEIDKISTSEDKSGDYNSLKKKADKVIANGYYESDEFFWHIFKKTIDIMLLDEVALNDEARFNDIFDKLWRLAMTKREEKLGGKNANF